MLRTYDTAILNFSLFDLVGISRIRLQISVPTEEEVNDV